MKAQAKLIIELQYDIYWAARTLRGHRNMHGVHGGSAAVGRSADAVSVVAGGLDGWRRVADAMTLALCGGGTVVVGCTRNMEGKNGCFRLGLSPSSIGSSRSHTLEERSYYPPLKQTLNSRCTLARLKY